MRVVVARIEQRRRRGLEDVWRPWRIRIWRRGRRHPVVAQMIVEILQFEARNKLVEKGSTFINLRFDEVSVASRLESLSVPILLITFHASSLTG